MTTSRRTYVLIMEPTADDWWRVHLESWIGDGGASTCTKSLIHQDDVTTVLDDLTWLTEPPMGFVFEDRPVTAKHFSPYSLRDPEMVTGAAWAATWGRPERWLPAPDDDDDGR